MKSRILICFLAFVLLFSACSNSDNTGTSNTPQDTLKASVTTEPVLEQPKETVPVTEKPKTCVSTLGYQFIQQIKIKDVKINSNGFSVNFIALDEKGETLIPSDGNLGITLYRTKTSFAGKLEKDQIEFQKSTAIKKDNFNGDCVSEIVNITFAQIQVDRAYYTIKPEDRGMMRVEFRTPGSTRAFEAEYWPNQAQDLLPPKASG